MNQVFAAMEMKVQITVDAHPQDREIIVDLQGEDMGVLIGKRGPPGAPLPSKLQQPGGKVLPLRCGYIRIYHSEENEDRR